MAQTKVTEDIRRLVRKAATIGCTIEEIAFLAGLGRSTIKRRCRKEVDEGRAKLRRGLRTKQLQVARRGNVTMLIWLGKQYLGQTDRQEVVQRGGKLRIVEEIVTEAVRRDQPETDAPAA